MLKDPIINWAKETYAFVRGTQKSSGFFPLLVFDAIALLLALLILVYGALIPGITTFAECLIGVIVMHFLVIFSVQAIRDPNFCRSESHVERIHKIQQEALGTERKRALSRELSIDVPPDQALMSNPPNIPGLQPPRLDAPESEKKPS